MIEIYTDGGCNTVSDLGGWAAVVIEDNKQSSYSGTAKQTTNNRMEITAAIEGISHTPAGSESTVFTDSEYLLGTMTKNWQRKANTDLWQKLDAAVKERKVRWKYVASEDTNPHHAEAHNLATGLTAGGETAEKPAPVKPGPAVKNAVTPAAEPVAIGLSHVDAEGRPRMVDVTEKADTEREAIARCEVVMKPETLALLKQNALPKGDVLTVAQVAGIMAAKRTSDLIPMCHPLLLGSIKVEFKIVEPDTVGITSRVKNIGKTGVEMEALTAASVAGLTVYDMCKAVDKGMRITNVRLVRKSGGKSGTIVLEPE